MSMTEFSGSSSRSAHMMLDGLLEDVAASKEIIALNKSDTDQMKRRIEELEEVVAELTSKLSSSNAQCELLSQRCKASQEHAAQLEGLKMRTDKVSSAQMKAHHELAQKEQATAARCLHLQTQVNSLEKENAELKERLVVSDGFNESIEAANEELMQSMAGMRSRLEDASPVGEV